MTENPLAIMAASWGYPREITAWEREEGRWVCNELGILWFMPPYPDGYEPPDGFDPSGVLVIHGIGNPDRGKRQALSADTARTIESLGRELGAGRLYVFDGPGAPACIPGIKRYLRRYGWLEDRWGSYKLL